MKSLILNEEAYQQRNSSTNRSICLHTGIPNRINTGYLPHHPNTKTKQNHTNAN